MQPEKQLTTSRYILKPVSYQAFEHTRNNYNDQPLSLTSTGHTCFASRLLMNHRIIRTTIVFLVGLLLFSGCGRTKTFYQEGVSLELARYRKKHIYDVAYQLHFTLPEQKDLPVEGVARISFKPLKARHGVILDFSPGKEYVNSLKVNNDSTIYSVSNGHIYIDANNLVPRQNNVIEIAFTATDQALNRSDEFMYTLLVPDRASTAFPCFDQPDLKAPFELSLDIPAHWTALSNGQETGIEENEDRKTVHFAPDQPISTYLFAFTAGEFDVISQSQNGRTLRMFHRETDQEKIDNNAPAIFEQHFAALQWLEEYTGIPYPYSKFDMAILPGFQYSGMEHPGAVWYRDSRVLLDENAPLTAQIRKASLIAHETAHMWFGNLVTMQWFDDVWLKEVFAGFMADKMIREQFPEENHQLQFVLSHYPRSYAVDRTRGTHPVKQHLSNMKMAGTLYGAIIYNKAPIVFEQLEKIMQPAPFRAAVQEYLSTFAHKNADWSDLVNIFDKHSQENISKWSNAWIYGKGMPEITWKTDLDPTNLVIEQVSAYEEKNFPAQFLGIHITDANKETNKMVWFHEDMVEVITEDKWQQPYLVMLNGKGAGYGFFKLRESDISFIADNLHLLSDKNLRAALYINMYENFLNGVVNADEFFHYLTIAIELETHQPLQDYLLGNLSTWAFNFPAFASHTAYQHQTEALLWKKLEEAEAEQAEMFFQSWMKLARSQESSLTMRDMYLGEQMPANLTLSESNRTQLALEAAVRNPANADLTAMELERTENPDRLRRLRFILPAVSHEQSSRDAFFASLSKPENRRPEPWVLEALYFLHHPSHPGQGIHYIEESLLMLEEIQATGDIFFPLNWLNATLQNYHQPEVAVMVNNYLDSHPDLMENLRLKVLQSADLNFRSAENS